MSKQASQKAKKKPDTGKAPAHKPAAAVKSRPKSAGGSKAAAVKKTVQRKEARPAAKKKPAAKAVARPAVKPAAKPVKSPIVRKAAPSKPSRAKSIADSRKAPAVARKPVVAKPAEKKPAKAAEPNAVVPKAVRAPDKGKSAPQSARKPDAPAVASAKVEKPVIQAPAAPYKAPSEFDGFRVNDHVVYPTHGVGKIIAVESQEIAGTRLELFVIAFDQEKMTLRVPLGKAKAVGMRILSSRDTVRNALKTLRGRARVKRTMWSRRAQEYEAKINSGDLLLIAEVVRDLHRAEGQPEQSYSERQIYESALDRMAREVGAVEELDTTAALERVGGALKKAA